MQIVNLHHFFVKVLRRLVREVNLRFNRRPSSRPFLSIDSFRLIADVIVESESDVFKFKRANHKIVFCKSEFLKNLFGSENFRLSKNLVIISGNSDINITEDFVVIPSSVSHWYCQNCLVRDSRITSLPIGLENAWWHNNGVVRDFHKAIENMPQKLTRVAYGFNLATNPVERSKALLVLEDNDLSERISSPPFLYKTELSRYKFVASPAGNGEDCHRTWEAFYLLTVPIVIRSDFIDLLDMPGMLVLDDWDDLNLLTEEMLNQIYEIKVNEIKNNTLLKFNYWEELILDKVEKVVL